MTEFYITRWQAISKAVLIPLAAVGYWAICIHLIPLNEPYVSATVNHLCEGALIFGAVLMAYIVAFHAFDGLKLLLRRTPIVTITSDQLQVYDFTYKCHRVFYWKDVVKIEEVSMRSATFFDVYVRNEERYQIIETNRWRRFMQRLNNSLLQGAAVRISPTILNISNRELFNILQSHISKK
jgi:hypothetical protein